ncbi:MAG TPA: hypothetical protein VGH63_18330 [Polyangia bacterium]
MKNAIAAIAVMLFVAHAFAEPPAPRFSFKVPSGWTDKSGDGRAYFTLAVDEPEHLAMQAKVQPGGTPVSPEFVTKYIDDARKSVAKILGGAELKVIEARNTTIAGVSAVRFVFELPAPTQAEDPQPTRQVQFYVPVGNEHAIITFTAPARSYARFEALFDKTAAATVIRK